MHEMAQHIKRLECSEHGTSLQKVCSQYITAWYTLLTVQEGTCISGHAQLRPVLLMQICLIMDEVDGMSGGDRGGVSELIQSIHRSKVPIICICNDKYNQKLRSLRNHTIELDYR